MRLSTLLMTQTKTAGINQYNLAQQSQSEKFNARKNFYLLRIIRPGIVSLCV